MKRTITYLSIFALFFAFGCKPNTPNNKKKRSNSPSSILNNSKQSKGDFEAKVNKNVDIAPYLSALQKDLNLTEPQIGVLKKIEEKHVKNIRTLKKEGNLNSKRRQELRQKKVASIKKLLGKKNFNEKSQFDKKWNAQN